MAFIRPRKTKETVRVLVAACLYYSGLVKLAHWWTRHSGQRLIILNYHRATGGDLRRQLLYLSRHYHIMHLEDALEKFYTPQKVRKQRRDRRIPLVLTFDDGYRDNYTHGFALAQELQIPFTIFLIPGYIGSGEPFWWREGERLVRNAPVDEVTIEGRAYHLGQTEERRALVQIIYSRVFHARSVAEREAFLADIRKALGVPLSVGEEEGALPLTWTEVREMEESGLVSFGAHTMHHPILAYLADPAEVRQEVGECRRVLEQQLGLPVRTFAYPVGKLRHIGDEGLRAVKEAGYRWAVTTIEDINNPQADSSLLRRLPGDPAQHWLVMASELVGLLGFVSRLRKKYRAWTRVSSGLPCRDHRASVRGGLKAN
jgi:peptidoglycan/xylan/chitin deacetylase (PgdA/CDA1 family)